MKHSKTNYPPVSVELTHSLIKELTVAASNDGQWGHITVDCLDLFITTVKNTPICTGNEC
jgi:hypothetical protein